MNAARTISSHIPLGLQPLKEFLRGAVLRGRFQRLDDGTYSANFRNLPPPVYLPLLRNEVVSVSVIFMDDPNFSDLQIFKGMKLRELWLAGCAHVSDLAPLRDMQLKVLNLNRTGVTDLTPLTALPLVDLSLDGCTKITDYHRFSPAEIRVKANAPLVLEVTNADGLADEFDSDSLKVEKVIAGGQKALVRIRPLAPGRYPFMGEYHAKTAQGVVVAE